MRAEDQLRNSYPGAFFLTVGDVLTVTDYLSGIGWLQRDERVDRVVRAGEGNMNCVLRIVTSQRSFILKQSRPWVAKYPSIAAPLDRALMEAQFYRQVGQHPTIASHMAKLLAFDPLERVLMLEDLEEARDFTFLYSPFARELQAETLEMLTNFLISLHSSFRDPSLAVPFANQEMRSLNHEHIFKFPLQGNNELDLEVTTPGLTKVARQLQANSRYCREVASLGELYLDTSQGTCLLHGDYFPGSWLKGPRGVDVIDPEFCFFGPPEWDVGVMIAHLHLAGQRLSSIETVTKQYTQSAALNTGLAYQFAGVEIMRRLIGVAQLPVCLGLERTVELLEFSQALVLENGGR